MKYIKVKNNQRFELGEIPVLSYNDFYETIINELIISKSNHCVNYFGFPANNKIKLICCFADDENHDIAVLSSIVESDAELESLTAKHLAFHLFEREIHENYGIQFQNHPWFKPVRYPWNRSNQNSTIANYPFYEIESEELHEVGVGPIHAGVIEPGHFRFICNGEQILHLEIQLGFQHRGIEQLFLEKKKLLEKATLAENIAGDTVVGHGVAFANTWESLCGFSPSDSLIFDRTMALEHERIAIHTGDLSAICTDVAYQLGSSVFGRLRTPVINYFQQWCGNRLAKSLIRPGKTNFPMNSFLKDRWHEVFDAYLPHFNEMCMQTFDLPSVLSRLEKTGVVSTETATSIGAVGTSARSSGILRDIRKTHPYLNYIKIQHEPVVHTSGDVFARAKIRWDEINQSIKHISEMLINIPKPEQEEKLNSPLSDSMVISLVEAWRGEICHCAITDKNSDLVVYKIKDPSFHNWLALAMAVRNNEISDFPICNKSFNLSYCGFDL